MNYRIKPIDRRLADKVRETMRSPQYGHPAFREVATGYGPCRQCLRTFDAGNEDRILFTYNALEGILDVPLPGPVFIHADKCEGYSDMAFPPDLIDLPLLFECYAADGSIIRTAPVDRKCAESQIATLLNETRAKFINIRNAEAGCHIAKILPAVTG